MQGRTHTSSGQPADVTRALTIPPDGHDDARRTSPPASGERQPTHTHGRGRPPRVMEEEEGEWEWEDEEETEEEEERPSGPHVSNIGSVIKGRLYCYTSLLGPR
jgi:hypothetical protein